MSTPQMSRRNSFSRWFLVSGLFAAFVLSSFAAEPTKSFDVPAGDAVTTLKQAAKQGGVEIMFPARSVQGVTTNPVKGDFTAKEAINRMLAQTELVLVQDEKTGAFTVNRLSNPNDPRVAQKDSGHPSDQSKVEEGKVVLPTFEVMGSKLLNMDIRRSKDDAQPYAVFDRQQIEDSGATNLDDFLKQRLSMNMRSASAVQTNNVNGNTNSIDLRGLGTGQTLILVDGHRVTGAFTGLGPQQANISGIPLAAIQRVEILPTTASGIYGGSATGGVVNVILRRDYAGVEVQATYENTFDTDSAIRQVSLSSGLNFEDGKSNLLIAANWSDNRGLLVQDRSFLADGRALMLANAPSSIFGPATPLLGATTNIRSSTGVNLTLKNGTPLNSPVTFVPAGYAGAASDAGVALVTNAGRYNLTPSSTPQNRGGRSSLVAGPSLKYLSATWRRQFSPRVQGFVDISGTENVNRSATGSLSGSYTIPASAPNNPFAQSIRVTAPIDAGTNFITTTNEDLRILGGMTFKLPKDWQSEFDYTWNRARHTRLQSAQLTGAEATAIANGTIDLLRDLNRFPVDLTSYLGNTGLNGPYRSTLSNVAARLAGPVGSLPGGTPTLAFLLEHRSQKIADADELSITGTRTFIPSRSDTVRSAYAEAKLPLFSSSNARRGIELLELQLAGRIDDYSVLGAGAIEDPGPNTAVVRRRNSQKSTNPTIAARFSPIPSIVLRASYGTGFLAPTVNQLVPDAPSLSTASFIDPRRGNTFTTPPIELTSGGNASLRPEESESWSAGLVYSPQRFQGFRFSLDYVRIAKSDNITTVSNNIQGLINLESYLPDRIKRGPVAPGDSFGVGPITAIDATSVNLARAQFEAVDLSLDYRLQTEHAGRFDFFAQATWQISYRSQATPQAPFIDTVGISTSTTFVPVEYKGNAGLTWRGRKWTVGWAARYIDGYLVANPSLTANATLIASQGNGGRVSSQIYHDLFVRFQLSAGRFRWTQGMEVQAGLKNLFDHRPPYDANAGSALILYSPFGDPRGLVYQVSVKSSF